MGSTRERMGFIRQSCQHQLCAKDSAMEAGLSYLIHQAALPASDQPDQTQTYRLMYPVTESWVCFGWRVVSIGRKAYWKGENGIYYRNRTI